MEKIFDRFVNAFRRTAQRVIQNIKRETVWEREEKTEVGKDSTDLLHRLEGLLQGAESDQYGDKKEQELPSDHPVEDIVADRKSEAASIDVTYTDDTRESVEYNTPRKPSAKSKATRPVGKAENTFQTEARARESKATEPTCRESDLSDQTDVAELRKEVEDLDKAIAEHIELTVNPESRGRRETIDELIEHWSRKENSTSGTT